MHGIQARLHATTSWQDLRMLSHTHLVKWIWRLSQTPWQYFVLLVKGHSRSHESHEFFLHCHVVLRDCCFDSKSKQLWASFCCQDGDVNVVNLVNHGILQPYCMPTVITISQQFMHQGCAIDLLPELWFVHLYVR